MRRYDSVTIALHWIVALWIAPQWMGAHAIDWFPKGAPRVDARSVHIVSGTLLLAVLLFRLYWRVRRGAEMVRPAVVADRVASKTVQLALYAVLAGVLSLGVFLAWLRGDSLFGLWRIPGFGTYAIADRHSFANSVTDLHSLAANTLLILAALHGAAALAHHFVLKDDVLRRMSPFRDEPGR